MLHLICSLNCCLTFGGHHGIQEGKKPTKEIFKLDLVALKAHRGMLKGSNFNESESIPPPTTIVHYYQTPMSVGTTRNLTDRDLRTSKMFKFFFS